MRDTSRTQFRPSNPPHRHQTHLAAPLPCCSILLQFPFWVQFVELGCLAHLLNDPWLTVWYPDSCKYRILSSLRSAWYNHSILRLGLYEMDFYLSTPSCCCRQVLGCCGGTFGKPLVRSSWILAKDNLWDTELVRIFLHPTHWGIWWNQKSDGDEISRRLGIQRTSECPSGVHRYSRVCSGAAVCLALGI